MFLIVHPRRPPPSSIIDWCWHPLVILPWTSSRCSQAIARNWRISPGESMYHWVSPCRLWSDEPDLSPASTIQQRQCSCTRLVFVDFLCCLSVFESIKLVCVLLQTHERYVVMILGVSCKSCLNASLVFMNSCKWFLPVLHMCVDFISKFHCGGGICCG
jgi:hypothetical protein